MSIGTLITEGIGSYGDIAHVITDGLDIGAPVVVPAKATILTQAFGALNVLASPFVVTEGFNSGVVVVTPPAEPTPPESGGAGRSRRKRTQYRLKLDDHEYQFDDLSEALEFIKRAKKILPELAPAKALELVSKGVKVGTAKKSEADGIELVAAPSSTRQIIQDRIDELESFYWKLVAKTVAELEDDEDVWLLM